MKNKRKKVGKIWALVLALCMVCMMSFPVLADDTLIATDDPRESILMIVLGYQDDNGVFLGYQSGTSFLINDEYVLTNKHVVSISTTEDIDENGVVDFDEFKEWAQENFTNVPDNLLVTDSHIKIKVYVNRDMKIDATMHSSVNSDDMDFAAVKLSEKIYDRKPVALGDSSTLTSKSVVYAMGFPEDSINVIEYNTKEDVSTTSGTVSKVAVITDQRGVSAKNIDAIEHSASLNHGNSGGPLLDENDIVMGVNSYGVGTKNYSIQINVIKKALDTFGIPYIDAAGASVPASTDNVDSETEGKSEEMKEPDNSAILAELQSALDDAKDVNPDDYTKESVAELDDCIDAAETVLRNSAASAMEIQSATDDLNDAINNLEPNPKPNFLLIGGIAAAVIIIAVIIVVVLVSGNKKKKAQADKNTLNQGSQGGYGATPAGAQSGYAAVPQQGIPAPQPQVMPEGAGETTLLDAGAGETTLLGGGGSAYLIRKKNGEKILLNVQNFKIGKERRRVNYCISDNTSVSRVHCEIVKKGTDYYVVDQGATNFTFVNGVQISPHTEALLSDQSILKLSDEEFEFHLS